VFEQLKQYFGDWRRAVEFMRAHANTVLCIPDLALTDQIATERQIAESVTRDGSKRNVARLASHYGLEGRLISKAHRDETRRRQAFRHPRVSRMRMRVSV
jgi:hypothetical protein